MCSQCVASVCAVTGCDQLVVNLLDYLIMQYSYSSCLCTFCNLITPVTFFVVVFSCYIIFSNCSQKGCINIFISTIIKYLD